MTVPANPKIYHIVHVDRLPSIISDGYLWCDAETKSRAPAGTTIGMSTIKQKRLNTPLDSHPDLCVGACVPFYFCPRSVMLYVIHQKNHSNLSYQDGQDPIIHLEADMRQAVAWAEKLPLRWAFTSANAGSNYFDDFCDLAQLKEIDWNAVQATDWRGHKKDGKQAEFLVEQHFPWELVTRIGVQNQQANRQVYAVVGKAAHQPPVGIQRYWYY